MILKSHVGFTSSEMTLYGIEFHNIIYIRPSKSLLVIALVSINLSKANLFDLRILNGLL